MVTATPALAPADLVTRWRGRPGAVIALACVAAGYTIVLAATTHIPLGWDEVVYISQYSHGVPATVFSAPRARGLPLLLAPVTALTTSVPVIRAYLAVLAGAGMFLAFWPWLRLRGGAIVPLAAGTFATQWLTVFYGAEAMPNLYVAYGVVTAVALLVHALRRPGWWPPLAGLGAVIAFTGLIRPFDATWAALPLVAAAVIAGRRRYAPLAAIAVGLAVSWGEWLAEAFALYGGPLTRLHGAGAENQTGLHFSLGAQLRALDGPLLCRPPTVCGGYPTAQLLWFAAIPLLAGLGIYAARRRPRPDAMLLAAVTATVMAASYLLLVGYAAPRFLMPCYALAALPVAEGIGWLWRPPYPRIRAVTLAVAVVGLLGYLTVQVRTVHGLADRENHSRTSDVQIGHRLGALGVTPPCLVYGSSAAQVAYYARCSSVGTGSHWHTAHTPGSVRATRAAGRHFAVVWHGERVPAAFLRTWRRVPVHHVNGRHWYIYLPPPT